MDINHSFATYYLKMWLLFKKKKDRTKNTEHMLGGSWSILVIYCY